MESELGAATAGALDVADDASTGAVDGVVDAASGVDVDEIGSVVVRRVADGEEDAVGSSDTVESGNPFGEDVFVDDCVPHDPGVAFSVPVSASVRVTQPGRPDGSYSVMPAGLAAVPTVRCMKNPSTATTCSPTH